MAPDRTFTFVHGPTLGSSISESDRSAARSWMLRRVFDQRRQEARREGSNHRAVAPRLQVQDREEREENSEELSASAGISSPGSSSSSRSSHRARNEVAKSRERCLIPSPVHMDGQRGDPFARHYLPDLDENHNELMDHCFYVVWPGFRKSDSYPLRFYRAWIHQSPDAPFLLHSLLYCSSNHALSLRGTVMYPRAEQLRHRSKALESLGAAITRDDSSPEALILSVLFLCLNDGVFLKGGIPNSFSPFTPPFPRLQWVDYYGSRDVHPLHWSAIVSLVEKQGGIDQVKSFGLPWMLTFASLLKAAREWSHPVYALIAADGTPYDYNYYMKALQAITKLDVYAPTGFDHLSGTLGMPNAVQQTFVDLRHLCQTIEMFCNGQTADIDIDCIGDCRNLVQHRLLSLPHYSVNCLDDVREQSPGTACSALLMYETCRLTALLFSTHVIFPTPYTCARRSQLVAKVQDVLKLVSQRGEDPSAEILRTLLWSTVISGIASRASTLRSWFVVELRRLSILMRLKEWEDAVAILRSFCWLDQACECAGRELWDETEVCHVS